MELLEPGQLTTGYLQARYGLILEQQFLENKQSLIDLLKSRFPCVEVNERFLDYVQEPRLLLVDKMHLVFELAKQSIFPNDTQLILLDPAQYEIIQQSGVYLLGLQRYYSADFHGEEIKKIELKKEQIEEWQKKGKQAVDEFVQELRFSLWSYNPVWLVVCKAKLESAACSIAMDGSDFYVNYACVPAASKEEARQKLIVYLEEDYLSAETIYKIKLFNPEEFISQDEFSIDMLERYDRAYITQKIHSFSLSPGCMTSFLITPCATIISKWHCDYAFWEKRTEKIEVCEFFPDTSLCFERLLELNKVTAADYDEFMQLDDGDGLEPVHYRLIPEGKNRFAKIQRSFKADGNLMIDWEDWHYDFSKKGDDYYLWVFIGGIADRSIEIKLKEHQAARYEREGMSYIHELIRQV